MIPFVDLPLYGRELVEDFGGKRTELLEV